MRKTISYFLYFVMIAAALGGLLYAHQQLTAADQGYAASVQQALAETARLQKIILYRPAEIPQGVSMSVLLGGLGLDRLAVADAIAETQRVFNPRQLRAGNPLAIGRGMAGDLRAIRYQVDYDRELWLTRKDQRFTAELKPIPYSTSVAKVAGRIDDSLFNAVLDAGETPELAVALAEIFAWDLDFYSDTRKGDTFKLVVEKKVYGGTVRYGRIFAAEYNNSGHPYQAVLFRDPAGEIAYYQPDGKALKKSFLKSPLKFAAPVTSHFSRDRLHPVLHTHRAHLGTDYGAPVGTPVQAIGSGKVIFAGRNGGAGNMVHIRHSNGFETQYLHLSRILVRNGEHVAQGAIVGRVGATGLATGPHLDFRIKQNGAYRNFEVLRRSLPPSEPVAKSQWAEFVTTRDKFLAMLEGAEAPVVATAGENTAGH